MNQTYYFIRVPSLVWAQSKYSLLRGSLVSVSTATTRSSVMRRRASYSKQTTTNNKEEKSKSTHQVAAAIDSFIILVYSFCFHCFMHKCTRSTNAFPKARISRSLQREASDLFYHSLCIITTCMIHSVYMHYIKVSSPAFPQSSWFFWYLYHPVLTFLKLTF